MAGRGGAVLQREGPVCIDLRIYFIREGFQFVHTVCGAIFFVYGFGFCFFLFVVGRVVVCSGAAGRDRCMKKKRRGRVSPALEGAATYSPACAVPSA